MANLPAALRDPAGGIGPISTGFFATNGSSLVAFSFSFPSRCSLVACVHANVAEVLPELGFHPMTRPPIEGAVGLLSAHPRHEALHEAVALRLLQAVDDGRDERDVRRQRRSRAQIHRSGA